MKATQYIPGGIRQRLIALLSLLLLAASAVFLLVFVGFYQNQMHAERAKMSMQVNLLLQAALENAMLKRDLPGLRAIVNQAGEQDQIKRVMILNPEREIRFSSSPDRLHQTLGVAESLDCSGCRDASLPKPKAAINVVRDTNGSEIFRSVNPIFNRTACTTCHGPLDENVVNGVLVVDYDGGAVRQKVMTATLGLAAAGMSVVLAVLGAVWFMVRSSILAPMRQLLNANEALAAGDFKGRVEIGSKDEFGALAGSFNSMASRLEGYVAELQRRDRFMQDLVNAVPDGIRLIDQDYNIVLTNDSYDRQLGIAPGSAVGKPCYQSSHQRAQPCTPTLVTCPLDQLRRGGLPLKALHTHHQASGGEIAVEVSAAELTTQKNGQSKTYIVEVIRDLEQEIRHSQEHRLAELGQLAAGVAHEVHNPLASVKLALQAFIRSEENKETPPASLEYLRKVDGQVDKCIDITKRLLNLVKPPSESLQVVSVPNAVRDVISLVSYDAKERGIKTEIDMVDPLRILATEGEIRMLTLNLVQNAFNAMPDGGRMTIQGRAEDGQCVLRFIDGGVGISEESQRRIFDPFFSHHARGRQGVGLGLTICRSIVDRYDGSIAVDSKPGEGTVFTVRFALADRSS